MSELSVKEKLLHEEYILLACIIINDRLDLIAIILTGCVIRDKRTFITSQECKACSFIIIDVLELGHSKTGTVAPCIKDISMKCILSRIISRIPISSPAITNPFTEYIIDKCIQLSITVIRISSCCLLARRFIRSPIRKP